MNASKLDFFLRNQLPLIIFVIIASFTITYFVSRAERDGVGYTPDQPIQFSHLLHAGQMQIDCKYCHTSVDKTRFASVPSVSTCMNCHSIARKDKPQIIKLTEYYNNNIPLPWKRIHMVPEYAYFNHSVHVNKGIECSSCHGPVEQMEKVGQLNSFTMGSCLNCHREAHDRFPELKDQINKGPEYCSACHR